MKKSNSQLLKSILVGALFFIMIIKLLELFFYNETIQYIVVPGVLGFLFFIHLSVKEASFLKFGRYILSLLILSSLFGSGLYLNLVYLGLRIPDYAFHLSIQAAISCTLIPAVLYWVAFLFKIILRK